MKNYMIAIIVFCCTAAGAQQEFFKDQRGKIMNEHQVDSAMQRLQEKLGANGMTVSKDILGKEVKDDSIIYDYQFRVMDSKSMGDTQKFSSYLGKPLPAFSLRDLSGKVVKSEDFKGKPIVINLWFTTCPPCIMEMPELNKLKADEEYRDVVFLAMTFESKRKVEAFLNKKPYTFHHLVDARDYCEKFTTSYPLNIFVNREGIITYFMSGMPLKRNAPGRKITGEEQVSPEWFIRELNKIK